MDRGKEEWGGGEFGEGNGSMGRGEGVRGGERSMVRRKGVWGGRSMGRREGVCVSRWIAVFLCFSLIALVFPIFPF